MPYASQKNKLEIFYLKNYIWKSFVLDGCHIYYWSKMHSNTRISLVCLDRFKQNKLDFMCRFIINCSWNLDLPLYITTKTTVETMDWNRWKCTKESKYAYISFLRHRDSSLGLQRCFDDWLSLEKQLPLNITVICWM